MNSSKQLVLLTGASGYVGGRMLRVLEESGYRIRCLARRPEYLQPRVAPGTEVVRGDLSDAATLPPAMRGVHTAYYLVHSMASTEDEFAERDRRAAEAFASAARASGVRRIVYLGGLGRGPALSRHLASRQEVGRILAASGVPTIELRASIIVGSGSLSFEMIRALVEKLPVMITPRWVNRLAQPIGIEDVVAYLLEALRAPAEVSGVFEIGGPERVSYLELMLEYASQRGLRRLMIPVPVLTPRLSSLWLGLVTPLYAQVGRALIDSVRNDTVVNDPQALTTFDVRPRSVQDAVARALRNEDREFAETRWSDALSWRRNTRSWGGQRFGRRIVDYRAVDVTETPVQAFIPIEGIGGRVGWYYGNWLWRFRGFLDLLFGGPGMRRGRRNPRSLIPGDTVDFWRVEAVEPGRLLRLQAEMKLPGRAWLQFEVLPREGGATIVQTAVFDPVGLAGLAYWYALYPIHAFVFGGMLRGVTRAIPRGSRSAVAGSAQRVEPAKTV